MGLVEMLSFSIIWGGVSWEKLSQQVLLKKKKLFKAVLRVCLE